MFIISPVPGGNKEYYTSAGPLQGLTVRFNIEEDEYLSPTYDVIGMLVILVSRGVD